MTETVVHVTTIEEWKSVLDVWFKQGYGWFSSDNTYAEKLFEQNGANQVGLVDYGFKYIVCWINNDYDGDNIIEYSELISRQKEDNKMATVYEVSQSVCDTLQRIRAHEDTSLIGSITWNAQFIESIEVGNKAIFRYLADDPAIEFKVKEQLYRLYLVDVLGQRNYFTISNATALPDRTVVKEKAFVETLEEIKKWKTPAWEIEKAE